MRWLDRAVILLASLILLALGLVGGLLVMGWAPLLNLAAQLASYRLEVAVAGILLLLVGSYLLVQSLSRSEPEGGVVRDTSLGTVQIQYRALETMVVKAAQEISGAKDVEATIKATPDGVRIRVSLNVLPGVKIPELADNVQKAVEEAVREMAGVLVTDVMVDVRNVVEQPKPRVE